MFRPEGRNYEQNSLLKNNKIEIKILTNPGLAQSGFEQLSFKCYNVPVFC